MATKRVGSTRMAHYFHGANAGAKIAAAVDDLPASGGIIDCTGFAGSQSITQNIFANLNNRPITMLLGAAQFHVTTALTMAGQYHPRIIGIGAGGDASSNSGQASQFVWDGANGGTVLTLDRVRDSQFENFAVIPGTGTIGIGIRIDHVNAPSGGLISTNNHFKNITIFNATTGIQIGNTSTQNNDHHTFEDVFIDGSGTYGYWINHSQSKWIHISRGSVWGRTYGIYQNAGSFNAEHMILSGNGTDFLLHTLWDTILITKCSSESAARFLDNDGGFVAPWPVMLMNNRYAPNAIHADGSFIRWNCRGGLTLFGNDFSDQTYVSGGNIYSQGGSDSGRIVSIGNIYPTSSVFVNNPQASSTDIVSIGDYGYNSGPTPVQMPILHGAAAQYSGGLTLSNGANNNIAVSGGLSNQEYYRISGPTGGFSISGFTGGALGRRLMLYNTTAQQMTITNDAGSSAGNKIKTLTGADVVLRAGTSFASFIYDINTSYWILQSTN